MTQDSTDRQSGCLLEYAGRHLAVHTEDTATLQWLVEFLCPAFRVIGERKPDWRITLQCSHSQYETLIERPGRAFPAKVDCFSLDGHFKRREAAVLNRDQLVLRDAKHRTGYLIDRRRANVDVIACSPGREIRVSIMRVIRELATVQGLALGSLPVHGSAFVENDRAVLLIGPKYSGKTSLLLHALRQPGVQFVSNDRLFLRNCDGGSYVRAMPTIFKIRPGTWEMLPQLAAAYRSRPFDRLDTLQESCERFSAGRGEMAVPWAVSARLSPAQLCELLGARSVGESAVGAVVFPRISAEVSTVRFERLSEEAAAARLYEEGLFRSGSPPRAAEAFVKAGEAVELNEEQWRANCLQLASQVPCFSCVLGRGAYRVPLFGLERMRAA